jgi:hypothetical protein
MSRALKELFGQFDWVQRSLIFIYVGLEQGPISCISPIRATGVKGSNRLIHREMRSFRSPPPEILDPLGRKYIKMAKDRGK